MAEDKDQFLKDAILALQDHFVKDWYTLGLYLGLQVKDLEVIESNSYVDKKTCVRQMLIKWKDKFDQEATWEKIVIALRETENKRLAREVEEKFIHPEERALKEGIIICFKIQLVWSYIILFHSTSKQTKQNTQLKQEFCLVLQRLCFTILNLKIILMGLFYHKYLYH